MASLSVIPFDQLKSRYNVDVSDAPGTPSLIADLGRGNLAADAPLVLVVDIDTPADSQFEIFLGSDRSDRCSLPHRGVISLSVALKAGGRMPAAGVASVGFRLHAAAGGRTIDIPCVLEVRLVTRELGRPDIGLSPEKEVTFGVTQGPVWAPAEVIIATLIPNLASTAVTYDGPPADLVVQTKAALITRPGAEPAALPVRIGIRPAGSGLPLDEASWSESDDDSNSWLRRTIPFPFETPVECVLAVVARDAIKIARLESDEGELRAEIDLDVSVTLIAGEREEKELLRRRHLRIPARFNAVTLITVSSRDLAPMVLALTRNRDADPVQPGNTVLRRRVNMNSESANRTSSLEADYKLAIEAFDAGDPRLDVEFTFVYDRTYEFPKLDIFDHELRHGQPIEVPLREILEASMLQSSQKRSHVPQRGELVILFRLLEFEASQDPLFARLSIPVEIEMIPPDVVACIDLGTSATTIWFGMMEGLNISAVLPLGDVIYAISGDAHEEFESGAGEANTLLPSLVGLSPDRHLRARLDPLSLGDIALSVGDIYGAEGRLKALHRYYDVSVPFVPRQDIPDCRDWIVFHPKRSLIGSQAHPLAINAYELTAGGSVRRTSQIDIRKLIVDVFDELGAYVVPRAISHFDRLMQQWPRPRALTDIWLSQHPIGAIVTHPSGVSAQARAAYVEAGRRFLARFTGQPVESLKGQNTSHLWVKLVPEAVAAVNYGIAHLRRHGLPPGKHVLAALDIGAGTYDATLVEAEIGIGGLENWTVLSHFGLTVGGLDLDRAIADKVTNILRDAFGESQVTSLFSLDLDTPAGAGGPGPATQQFAREIAFHDEIQRAKKQLTASLLGLPESAAYVWTAESGILFEVVVGREPEREVLPVRRRQPGRPVSAQQRIPVDPIGPTWLVARQNRRDGSVEIVLQIGPGHFAADAAGPIDAVNPATVARFLGAVLPRMLLREVARLEKDPPTWIVTGRTALWPPLYAAIAAVAESERGSRMASARPFPPSEMKAAVINGALALASNPHLSLGNEILNPLAVVSISAEARTTDSRGMTAGRRATGIGAIRYLTGSDQRSGQDDVICSGRCELVRAVPGLSAPNGQGDPDGEALDMFDAFAISPYERLVSDIAQTGSTEPRQLRVTWNAGNRATSVTIELGDGRGAQRFEVPNRESRIYHD
jgi:hypothetical protein